MKPTLQIGFGGTGAQPVPLGHRPDGIAARELKRIINFTASRAAPAARQVAAQTGQVTHSTQI